MTSAALSIALTAAQVAALAAGTPVSLNVTLTPPSSSSGSGPFILPAGAVPMFVNGVNHMAGDWSFGSPAPSINYSAPGGIDGANCVAFTSNAQWSGFQPYFEGNPPEQLITSALNYMYIAVKPTKSPQKWQMGWMQTVPVSSQYPTGEAPLGTVISDISEFATGPANAAGWTIYRLPLGEGGFNIPVGSEARKWMIQDDTGDSSNLVYLDRYYLAAS